MIVSKWHETLFDIQYGSKSVIFLYKKKFTKQLILEIKKRNFHCVKFRLKQNKEYFK